MPAPAWGLTVAYWLHMLATVVWIGSLASLALVVLPAAGRALEAGMYARLLEQIQHRLDPLGWFCLLVLTGTGLFQMSASPNYQGFFAIDNTWAAAILAKHLLFLGMISVSAWSTWGVLPALRRATMRAAKELALAKEHSPTQAPPLNQGLADALRLQGRILLLLRINLLFSVVVLALTALARAS
jgi:uncharacterized membrane protein